MSKLPRRVMLGLMGRGGAAAAAAAVAGPAVLTNTLQAAPTDDELRRMAALQLMTGQPLNQAGHLRSYGDWQEETRRLHEEEAFQASQPDPVGDALITISALFARIPEACAVPRGLDIPFATTPQNLYLRAPFEAEEEAHLQPQLQWLIDQVDRGQYAALIDLTQRFYEDHKRDDIERVPRLTKADMASRLWSHNLCIDVAELTASRLALAVIAMGTAPITRWAELWEAAHNAAMLKHGRPGIVAYAKDTELKLAIKREGPILQLASYNEMAGKLV